MSKHKPKILPPDLAIRRCPKCGKGKMVSHHRRIDFLSVKSIFNCPNCNHETSLDPGGAAGVHLAAGLLATVILSFILWGSRGGYDRSDIIKTLILLTLFTAPAWLTALKMRQYPVTGLRSKTSEENEVLRPETGSNDPLQRGIVRMNRLSPVTGFFGVLIFVTLFLGVATLIGWINFTYFDDQLFG